MINNCIIHNNFALYKMIEHSRLRSFNNFIFNILSAIAAYCFFPKKPSVEIDFVDDGQLELF